MKYIEHELITIKPKLLINDIFIVSVHKTIFKIYLFVIKLYYALNCFNVFFSFNFNKYLIL